MTTRETTVSREFNVKLVNMITGEQVEFESIEAAIAKLEADAQSLGMDGDQARSVITALKRQASVGTGTIDVSMKPEDKECTCEACNQTRLKGASVALEEQAMSYAELLSEHLVDAIETIARMKAHGAPEEAMGLVYMQLRIAVNAITRNSMAGIEGRLKHLEARDKMPANVVPMRGTKH